MTWTCENCGARFPDSDGERGDGCLSCTHIVTDDTLYELYCTLADATTAASTGDPNTCAEKAAEAKRAVMALQTDGESA